MGVTVLAVELVVEKVDTLKVVNVHEHGSLLAEEAEETA